MMDVEVPRDIESLRVLLEYYIVRCHKLKGYLDAEKRVNRELQYKLQEANRKVAKEEDDE